jgi:hypothetical protein
MKHALVAAPPGKGLPRPHQPGLQERRQAADDLARVSGSGRRSGSGRDPAASCGDWR